MARELALLAGGAGTIGQVITRRLVEAGLEAVVIGRRPEPLHALAGPHIRACMADLTQDSAVETIAAALDAPVRMVVHAVGVPVAGGILNAPPQALLTAMDAKVCGLLRLVRAAEARFVPRSRIVAIAGHYGLEPTAFAATAGVSNAALFNLCRQLALAYGPRQVTAHAVSLGPADTERLRGIAASEAARRQAPVDEVLAEMRRESAIGSFVAPEQVAWAVAALLAPEADAMTGSTMMLDAGRRHGLP